MFVGAANGSTITTTFDTDRDDWMVADLVQPFNGLPMLAHDYTPSWTGGRGLPPGCIQQAEISGNVWYFSAPAKFLGDRSASLYGTLTWDLAVNPSSQGGTNTFEQLILHDGTNALYYFDTGPGQANGWRHYSVPLVGASFRVGSRTNSPATDLQLQMVLTNLRALYILGDWVEGSEVGYLDNVMMTEGGPAHLTPLLQGKWPELTRGVAYDVQVAGNRAYLALGYGGLAILDVSNPAAPVRLGGYDTSGEARGVAVSGSVAYVADNTAGLQIIDVSNPANPVRLGSYNTGGQAFGVAVSGTIAYVADC